MIATNQILVDGINQIIIDNDSHYFKKDLKQYQEKFITLKENGSILQHDFNDFTWIMKANHRDLGDVKSITFELSQYSDVNTAIKCLTIIFLEKGFTGSHVDVVIRLLQRAIKVSNCFAEDMVEEFEEFIFSQADFTKKRLVTIIQLFFNFYEFEHVIDDYIDILNMIPMPENGNCQHSCRKCHSEFVRNSASIKESFSGFSQTWFGSVQFRVFRAQRSGFFDLAAS